MLWVYRASPNARWCFWSTGCTSVTTLQRFSRVFLSTDHQIQVPERSAPWVGCVDIRHWPRHGTQDILRTSLQNRTLRSTLLSASGHLMGDIKCHHCWASAERRGSFGSGQWWACHSPEHEKGLCSHLNVHTRVWSTPCDCSRKLRCKRLNWSAVLGPSIWTTHPVGCQTRSLICYCSNNTRYRRVIVKCYTESLAFISRKSQMNSIPKTAAQSARC